MLHMTDNAAEAVRKLSADSGLEPEPGLRIAPGDPTSTGTPLELSLAPGPETNDQTAEEGGATIYVEEELTAFLDDKVLDASVEDGRVRFRLADAPAS
jgi:iron-sulfur cluster assembly protein